MDVSRMDRSLGELFSDLTQQTADLIRQEVRLAKTELGLKASEVGRNAMMVGAGAAFGLTALITIAAALTLLLIDLGMRPWVAAAVCAGILGVSAFALMRSGIAALRGRRLAPEQTIDSLKETTQWLKNGTR